MDETQTFSKQLSDTQLQLALTWAAIILGLLIKFSKDFKAVKEGLLSMWASIADFWKWTIRKAMWRKRQMEMIQRMTDSFYGLKNDVLDIKKEVQHNGGGSLKDAVRRLEENQRLMKEMLDENKKIRDAQELNSNNMTFKVNSNRAFFFISDAFLRHFGCQSSDVLGFAYENLIHKDDLNEMRIRLQRAIETRTPFSEEVRIRSCHTGEYEKVLLIAQPVDVNDVLKKFVGAVKILND